jgi:hypothetical protein
MPIDMRIRKIKGDADDDHALQVAKPVLNSLVQITTELIARPKRATVGVKQGRF